MKKVECALWLMKRATPTDHQWLAWLNPVLVVDNLARFTDPGVEAYTFAHGGRAVIALPHDPLHLEIPKIAQLFRHEIWHWRRNRLGQAVLTPHLCSGPACSNPLERSADPIYAGDARYLAVYRAHWRNARGPQVEAAINAGL